jgi:hypothetical protein
VARALLSIIAIYIRTTMKSLKCFLAILVLTAALAISAKADLLYLGSVNFSNGPNDPGTNLAALDAFLPGDQSGLTLTPSGNHENLSGATTIDVTPGSYLVVHYGKGKLGLGDGGSWEFFQVINGETSVTLPALGNELINPDLFGHGGISSIREFGNPPPTTPDSGSTVMLLGVALGSVEMLRRLVLKKAL